MTSASIRLTPEITYLQFKKVFRYLNINFIYFQKIPDII